MSSDDQLESASESSMRPTPSRVLAEEDRERQQLLDEIDRLKRDNERLTRENTLHQYVACLF